MHIVNSGLSDTQGHGSLDKSLHAGAWFVKEGNDFKLDTLDNVLSNIDGNLFLIKLDVEGHELKALSGSKQTISKHHPLIMVEVVRNQLERNGHAPEDIENFMSSINYAETWKGGMDKLYEYMPNNAASEVDDKPPQNYDFFVFLIVMFIIVVIACIVIASLRGR